MDSFCKVCSPLNENEFYIYLTIVVLFIIIGSSYLFSNDEINNLSFVLILWVVINLIFLIFFYGFTKIKRIQNGPIISKLVNIVFFIMLILHLIWAIEIKKMNKNDLNIPIIIIIIIAIGISTISYLNRNLLVFGLSVLYIILWLYIIYAYSLIET